MNLARLAVVALVAQTPTAPPPPSATVTGLVVLSNTRQPVAGASVQLFRAGARDASGRQPPQGQGDGPGGPAGPRPEDLARYSARTAQDGRFVFDHVAPGTYRLVALHSGAYVPGEFAQRSATSVGIPLDLAPGERLDNVQLTLTPTASISGRVYGREGPVGRIQVQALRPVYRNGVRSLTIVQSVQTNDRGEYRLFWLPPGAYHVTARPFNDGMISGVSIVEPSRTGTFELASSPVIVTRVLPTGETIEETQLPVYFPGTTDPSGAARIELTAGASLDGFDVSIDDAPVRTHHLRGAVTANGQPAGAAAILAIPRDAGPSPTIAAARTNPDGSFDVPGVLPGSYLLFASTNSGTSGAVPLQVPDADVGSLAISLIPGFRVAGRLLLDDRARASVSDIGLLRATITRTPALLGMPEGGPTFAPPPSADGSFVLEGVPPGDFQVTVRGLPPGAYLKSIRLGAADVLETGLHVAGPPRDLLEIVIAAGGTVSGAVVDGRQDPVVNSRVVLVPDASLRHRADLYRTGLTDRSGRFRLEGVAEGTYTALAWDDVEDGAWQDPDFVRPFESRAATVRVRDAADQTIQLTVISAGQR